MRDTIFRFREAERRRHPERSRNAVRYPPSLKQRVIAVARRRRAQGASLWRIGRELGLGQQTLRGWLKASPAPRMRVVKVALADPAGEPARPEAGHAVLTTPKGYRVEGLTLESLTALLRFLS